MRFVAMNKFSSAWGILILCSHLTLGASETSGSTGAISSSIKEPFPKDDELAMFSSVNQLQAKVLGLEETMERNRKHTEGVLHQQDEVLKRIDSQMSEIRDTLSAHGEQLGNIDLVSEEYFAFSNHTCGGVLLGRTGYIVYGDEHEPVDNARFHQKVHPTSCVWTIRANNRPTIKLTTHALNKGLGGGGGRRNKAFVIELLPPNPMLTNSTLTMKKTKLKPHRQYMLSGPLIFLVYILVDHGHTSASLHAQFEGIVEKHGKASSVTTRFSHELLQVYGSAQKFEDTDFRIKPSEANFTRELMTLVISNYSTRILLQIGFNKGQCATGNDQFLLIRVNDKDSGASVTDCCVIDCNSLFTLTGNPALLIMSKRFGQKLPFNLSWDVEKPYPSDSSYLSRVGDDEIGTPCGEILGGLSGKITYNPNMPYRNNERCIWIIVPQPMPRSSIRVTIDHQGLEEYYDKLYIMELTDEQGNLLHSGPKMNGVYLKRNTTFEATSREVFIVLYTDGYVTGTGFTLEYLVVGDRVPTDVTTSYSLLKQDKGSISTALQLDHAKYSVFALAVRESTAYNRVLRLHLNSTTPTIHSQGGGCLLSETVTIFTTHFGGVFKDATVGLCDNSNAITVNAEEDLAVVILNNTRGQVDSTFHLSWEHVLPTGNSSSIPKTDENLCGGVIEGDKGIIQYKPRKMYENFEACVWIIHSPGSARISLNLRKDGFESCCDYLVASSVTSELESTMPGVRIDRTHPIAVINASMAIVLFRSDSSDTGTGFVLHFMASGSSSPEDPTYRVVHRNESTGRFVYNPTEDYSIDDIQRSERDILVFAYSTGNRHRNGNLSTYDPTDNPVVAFDSGDFARDASEDCSYDTLSMYTYQSGNRSWDLFRQLPDQESQSRGLCPSVISVPEKGSWFHATHSAFVAVWRPLANSANMTGYFSISWKKGTGCGEVIVGESGEISFNEGSAYRIYERCLWLIEVPQAQEVHLRLVKQGFERCCDFIMVGTINPSYTSPNLEDLRILGGSERMQSAAFVRGPVIAVLFVSDGSVSGTGFRLTFTKTQTLPESSLRYRLAVEKEAPGSFAFEVEPNEVVIAGHSVPRRFFVNSPSQLTRMPNITLSVFRPYLSTTCASDEFSLVEFVESPLGRRLSRVHRYTATNVYRFMGHANYSGSGGHCPALNESQLGTCEVIEACQNSPTSNSMTLSEIGNLVWIAVYKAIGVDHNATLFEPRGFKLDFQY